MGVETADVERAVGVLNHELGQPFLREVCTAFIERVFGGRQLFESIELIDRLVPGPGPRIPEPAGPIFKPDAQLHPRARSLLRVSDLQAQPPSASSREPVRIGFWLLTQIARLWSLRPRA